MIILSSHDILIIIIIIIIIIISSSSHKRAPQVYWFSTFLSPLQRLIEKRHEQIMMQTCPSESKSRSGNSSSETPAAYQNDLLVPLGVGAVQHLTAKVTSLSESWTWGLLPCHGWLGDLKFQTYQNMSAINNSSIHVSNAQFKNYWNIEKNLWYLWHIAAKGVNPHLLMQLTKAAA